MPRRTSSRHPLPRYPHFHYTGLIRELSYALEALLQASDWQETPPTDSTPTQAKAQELGNIRLALSRLRGPLSILSEREEKLNAALTAAAQPKGRRR